MNASRAAREGRFDVVVLGGGPAGAAVALALRQQTEFSVALVERAGRTALRVGETLSPGTQDLLKYLRVWEEFQAAGHRRALGHSASWGSAQLTTRDFIFSPFGPGWHLDRPRFDRMLLDAVRAAGGTVWPGTYLLDGRPERDTGWQLTLRGPRGRHRVTAAFVVDATGRAGGWLRRMGIARPPLDRLVALVGTVRLPRDATCEAFTLLEAQEAGWWYSAPLPRGRMIATFLTDADVLRRRGFTPAVAWRAARAASTHTAPRLRGSALVGAVRVCAAHSARAAQIVGPRWLAVGDAAASHDPLSGSGIPRALDSGIHAARAIAAFLRRGDETLLHGYATKIAREFDAYLALRERYYALERRWPASPFWSRRCPRAPGRAPA